MSVLPTHTGERVYEPYSAEVGQDWDVIVIGSGMGGMSAAATLSKLGHRVLLLEQHYLPGGFTHMFGRKGFKWDVGVHVIGEMRRWDMPRRLLNWLTNGEVKMNSTGDPFDSFYFPSGHVFRMPEGEKKLLQGLAEEFPEDREELRRYWRLVKKAALVCRGFFVFQTLPKWLDRLLSALWYRLFPNYWTMTTASILDGFRFSPRLRTYLTSHWGYYGAIPDDSSFAVHALTHLHFCNGAYFPQGGSQAFASAMLANLRSTGGKVLTRAEVDEVMIENGAAVGVRMADGHRFHAPVVISAAGAKTTAGRLVPESYRSTDWAQQLMQLQDSPSYLCLNLGFRGDIRQAGASGCNRWLYTIENNDRTLWDINNEHERPHILYVSFPSLKDPDHEHGPDFVHTGECVTFVHWEAFKTWRDTTLKKRPGDYEALKSELTRRILEELTIHMPEIMESLVFSELSTPLTAQHFARASQGAIYGLAATPARFACPELRVRTPIKNFLLAGVDVAACGVVSAMVSGVLAATVVDKRAYLRLL